MVNLFESSKKTQSLNPCSTSTEASLPPPHLKDLSYSVSFTGCRFTDPNFKSWATEMAETHRPIWEKSGILEAVKATSYRIHKDTDLLLSLAQKWCIKTNTFVFSWGEATITLEDVMVLLGFSVLGSPVCATLDSEGEEIKKKLEVEWSKISKDNFMSLAAWMKRFKGYGDVELEHVAFLVAWLGYFVFPSRSCHLIRGILSIGVQLSRGVRIALAPAVLAHLYGDLSCLKTHVREFSKCSKIVLSGLFKLVQVWAWERFGELQPVGNVLNKGESRLALWHDLRHTASGVRRVLDNSKVDSFEWRPYTKTMKNWEFPRFDDEFVSFARCIKVSELVGIGFVEQYFPNRVASQFGMLQDVPRPRTEEAAWTDSVVPFDEDESMERPEKEQKNEETGYSGSKSGNDMVISPTDEYHSTDSPLGFDEAVDIVVSPPKKRQRCEDELDVFRSKSPECLLSKEKASSSEREDDIVYDDKLIDDGTKEPECLLSEDGDVVLENASSGEKEDDDVDDDKLIKDNSKEPEGPLHEDDAIAGEKASSDEKEDDVVGVDKLIDDGSKEPLNLIKDNSKEPVSLLHEDEQTSADEKEDDVVGDDKMIDDGSKEPECLLPEDDAIAGEKASSGEKEDDAVNDNSLIHIAIGGEPQGQECLHLDNALGNEETNEQLEDLENRNEDVGEDDLGNDSTYRTNLLKLKDSYEKSTQKMKRLESRIDELLIKAYENLVSLMNGEPQDRELAAARLI